MVELLQGVRSRRAYPPWRGLWSRGWLNVGVALASASLIGGCALPHAAAPEDPPPEAEAQLGAGGLSVEQHRALRAGNRVEQHLELDRQGQHYVGGVSYVLVRAEPRQVFDVLNQLDTLSQVLPQTRSTTIIDRSGDRVRVEIEQGTGMLSTTLSVFFRLEPTEEKNDGHAVRFWLDPSRPHGIDDVWGFFRASRYDSGHSLVTVGALVNLGPGVMRMLFEQRMAHSLLKIPDRIRDTVERTYGASALSPEAVSITVP